MCLCGAMPSVCSVKSSHRKKRRHLQSTAQVMCWIQRFMTHQSMTHTLSAISTFSLRDMKRIQSISPKISILMTTFACNGEPLVMNISSPLLLLTPPNTSHWRRGSLAFGYLHQLLIPKSHNLWWILWFVSSVCSLLLELTRMGFVSSC